MKLTKTVLVLALVVGIVATGVAVTQAVELSAPAMFILFLGLGFGVFVVWDRVLFRDVDTVAEIVERQNLALAVFYLVPALLVLGASLAL